MASTHLALNYHIVFSTKNREPLISQTFQEALHRFMTGVIQNLNGVSVAIGGTSDHVHLVIRLRATHCLADVVRDIKRSSSEWIHESQKSYQFAWQEGYGAFTVSPTQIDAVREYVLNQETHHQRRTFQQEYVAMLNRSGIEYNERYIWT